VTLRHLQLFALDGCDRILLSLIFLASSEPHPTPEARQPAREGDRRKPRAGSELAGRSEAA